MRKIILGHFFRPPQDWQFQVGDIAGHPALEKAYEIGNSIEYEYGMKCFHPIFRVLRTLASCRT